MAQYDIHLIQNTSGSGIEFSEKQVNIAKGGLLSAATGGVPTVLAGGTDGYHLVRDDNEVTGLKWVAVSATHTQNTDTGTTNNTFTVDSDGTTGKIILDADNVGANYTTTIQNQAQAASIVLTLPGVTGTLATEAFATGLFSSTDAMIFKGTVGSGGTHEIAAFNSLATYDAGWTYKVITAGTIKGKVCEIGDMVIATVDRAGSGNVDADWVAVQTNVDGGVTGPASAVTTNIATFNGTSGKIIQDGGVAISALATSTHAHGNVTNAGYIGSTANLPIITGTGGILQAGAFGTGATQFCVGNDSRLSDARTPTSHTHGNITNAGAIGSTANLPIITTTSGVLTAGAFGTGSTDFTVGNDARLSDARNVLWVTAPSTKTSVGTIGQFAKDDNYIYICTATNVWKRSPIATNWTNPV